VFGRRRQIQFATVESRSYSFVRKLQKQAALRFGVFSHKGFSR
jgi:hypothetical protein